MQERLPVEIQNQVVGADVPNQERVGGQQGEGFLALRGGRVQPACLRPGSGGEHAAGRRGGLEPGALRVLVPGAGGGARVRQCAQPGAVLRGRRVRQQRRGRGRLGRAVALRARARRRDADPGSSDSNERDYREVRD